MQSCDTNIIDACYLASHLFRYKCGLLRNWNIRGPSADYANLSSRSTMYIVRFVDYHCSSGSMNTHIIRVKHITKYFYSFDWHSTDNRSSCFIQQLTSHRNDLFNFFCLAIDNLRHPFTLLTMKIRSNLDYP